MHPLCKGSFHGIKSMLDHFARISLPCVPEGRYSHVLKPTAAGPSASSDCFGVQQLLQIPSDNFCYVLIFWVNPTLLCWPKWFKYTHLGSSRQLVPLPPLGCCCLQCTALWEPKCHCLTATTLRGYSPSAAFRGWQPLELIKPSHRSSLSLLPCTLLALLHCSLSPAPVPSPRCNRSQQSGSVSLSFALLESGIFLGFTCVQNSVECQLDTWKMRGVWTRRAMPSSQGKHLFTSHTQGLSQLPNCPHWRHLCVALPLELCCVSSWGLSTDSPWHSQAGHAGEQPKTKQHSLFWGVSYEIHIPRGALGVAKWVCDSLHSNGKAY